MKFKLGDKVRVREDLEINNVYQDLRSQYAGQELTIVNLVGEHYVTKETELWWTEEMLEPIEDPLVDKILERNNKTYTPPNTGDPWIDNLPEEYFEMYEEEELVNRPSHYNNADKDLFDEWHERYYHSEKTYTGREVFIEIMKSVAERYARRYPNKNPEDIDKAIYTLNRLKEYEKLEEEE